MAGWGQSTQDAHSLSVVAAQHDRVLGRVQIQSTEPKTRVEWS
jgi:hypothetical protein